MMKTNQCSTTTTTTTRKEVPSAQQLPSTTKCIIQYLPQGYRTYLLSNILEVPPEFNPWEVGQIVPSTLGLTFKDEASSSSSSSKMEPLADNEDNETSSEHHMSILQRSIPEGIEVYVLSSSVTAPIPENLVGSFRVALVSSVSSNNQVHPFATSPPSIQTVDEMGECTTESLEDCCLYSREKCARLHYPGSPDPTRTDCCRVSFACRHSSMIRGAILNERLVLSSASSSDLKKEHHADSTKQQQVSSNNDDDGAVQLASATDVSSTPTTEPQQQKHQSSSAQKKNSVPTSSAKRTQTKTRVANTEKTPSKSSSSTTNDNKGTPVETPKQARKIPKVIWIRNKLKERYMEDHPEETPKNTKACSAYVNKIWESKRDELEKTWAEEYAQYERDFNTQKKLSQGSAPQSKTPASKPSTSTTAKKDSAIPTKVLSKRKTSDSPKEESPAPKKAKSTAPSSKRQQQQQDEKESDSVEQKKKKVSSSSPNNVSSSLLSANTDRLSLSKTVTPSKAPESSTNPKKRPSHGMKSPRTQTPSSESSSSSNSVKKCIYALIKDYIAKETNLTTSKERLTKYVKELHIDNVNKGIIENADKKGTLSFDQFCNIMGYRKSQVIRSCVIIEQSKKSSETSEDSLDDVDLEEDDEDDDDPMDEETSSSLDGLIVKDASNYDDDEEDYDPSNDNQKNNTHKHDEDDDGENKSMNSEDDDGGNGETPSSSEDD